jgi:hypothetical protein
MAAALTDRCLSSHGLCQGQWDQHAHGVGVVLDDLGKARGRWDGLRAQPASAISINDQVAASVGGKLLVLLPSTVHAQKRVALVVSIDMLPN